MWRRRTSAAVRWGLTVTALLALVTWILSLGLFVGWAGMVPQRCVALGRGCLKVAVERKAGLGKVPRVTYSEGWQLAGPQRPSWWLDYFDLSFDLSGSYPSLEIPLWLVVCACGVPTALMWRANWRARKNN